LGEGDQEQSFPARVNVIVEKPGKGALAVEAIAQDGMIMIENAYFYGDASLAHAKTADKIHARQDLYVGLWTDARSKNVGRFAFEGIHY
jgi:complement component 1 Q subcomponent-binding protein